MLQHEQTLKTLGQVKKSGTKDQVLYDFIYKKCPLNRQIYRHRKKISGCVVLRVENGGQGLLMCAGFLLGVIKS